jgi:methanogenic corrinoid protein MtbC1
MKILKALSQAIVDLDEDKIHKLVKEKIEASEDPVSIIKECRDGMRAVGDLFNEKKYLLSELIMSGEIFKDIMYDLEPLFGDIEEGEKGDVVVIGTVKDDIHDIGKDIVITLLKAEGFTVVDLGVDVSADKFVEAVKDTGARVVALSCLLSNTFLNMKEVIRKITEAGLRGNIKIVIGGAACDEDVCKYVGADYYAAEATLGISYIKEVYERS